MAKCLTGIDQVRFFVTEHPGKENLDNIILEPLVAFVNEKAKRPIVKICAGSEETISKTLGITCKK